MRNNLIKKFICMTISLLLIVAAVHFDERTTNAEPFEGSGSVEVGSISIQLLDSQP